MPGLRARFLWSITLVGVSVGILLLAPGRPGTTLRAQQQDPLAEPFKGVTTDGTVRPGLFSLRSTGVTTAPLRTSTEAFLAALTEEQRKRTVFPVDDNEWRLWNNVHRYNRQGVSFEEMTESQREAGFGLMRAALSEKGFRTARDIMRLNGHLGELLPERAAEYGEFPYFLTVMGTPSATEPWGWQLDGHHLIVNTFVLGDQLVMSPVFMGSEPVVATSGKYAGARVFDAEEARGLALMRALRPDQRSKAVIETEKVRNNAMAQAFRDNLVLDYAGLRGNALDEAQRRLLLALIGEYVGHMRDGHAAVRMDEVRQHLDETYFAWIGGSGPDDAFYYRVQSPVILIEFDHQLPVALPGPRVPGRIHIHTVVRTPNGNDYGKDLLRQHYERHRGDAAHGHAH